QPDFHLVPKNGLGEIELELVAKIGAPINLRAAAAACATEDVAEYIAEDVAEGVSAEPAAAPGAPRGRLDARVPILVVGRPLVRVGQHLAGLLGLLEGLLRLPIVRVAIGVIFHGKAAIGLLDLRLGRPPRYVEYLVVVALRHGPSLRGLASLVLDLLEFRVPCVFATRPGPAAATRRTCAGSGLGTRSRCPGLARRIGTLRDAGGGLRERLALLVDHAAVIALQRRAQIGDRTLDPGALGRIHLVAEILQRLLDGVNQAIRLVARFDQLAEALVFLSVCLGVAHHALDLVLVQSARGFDDDLLLLTGGLVLG